MMLDKSVLFFATDKNKSENYCVNSLVSVSDCLLSVS